MTDDEFNAFVLRELKTLVDALEEKIQAKDDEIARLNELFDEQANAAKSQFMINAQLRAQAESWPRRCSEQCRAEGLRVPASGNLWRRKLYLNTKPVSNLFTSALCRIGS